MTMDHSTIENILRADYNRETWKGFLRNLFPFSTFWSSPQSLDDLTSPYVASALRIGDVKLDESGIERSIGLFEVVLDEKVILERNRVGLRNLLRKYWKDMDGAFIVYTQPSSGLWRFTYVSELTGFDASGDYREIKTDPKRYTYVFGHGESCRTAVERFQTLLAKGKKATIADVIDAFSVEKLSKSFFDGYKKQYELFCEYLTAKPGIFKVSFNGDEKAVRDFVKLFLGRITFLYFIQKKGWLGVPLNGNWGDGDKHFLWSVFQSHKHKSLFYREVLTKLFFDTLNTPRESDLIELPDGEKVKIPFLNGGLFEEENPNYRNIVFKEDLFEDLFNFFNQYNFTIYEDDPNDHTVAVDPEMLGHIFENLLEDNKDKGAFYTPKEIVHYMSQESLIEYLTTWFENKGYEVVGHTSFKDTSETLFVNPNDYNHGQLELETPVYSEENKIDRSVIEKLLKKSLDDSDRSLISQYIDEFNKALDSVKICDPAIGSGAFPMGLLQEIFAAKQTLWHFKYGNLDEFPASEIKLNIIQNSIYGVDIEKGAVDIARLRFWLSLVVDEAEPKPLPNLDYKIVVGNSLVSTFDDVVIKIDWQIDETGYGLFGADKAEEIKKVIGRIIDRQRAYFDPKADKKRLAEDIRILKIDLLINQLELKTSSYNVEMVHTNEKLKVLNTNERILELKVMKKLIDQLHRQKGSPSRSLNFFDWKLDFPEVLNELIVDEPGFDIVIGNPPYVQLQKNGGTLAKIFEAQNFDTFSSMGDIYCLFYEKGLKILKNNGTLNFITSNKWMRSGYGMNLRSYLLEFNPLKLINLGSKIFTTATVDTNILVIQKCENKSVLRAIDISKMKDGKKIDFHNKTFVHLTKLSSDSWIIADNLGLRIRNKVEQFGKPLKSWNVKINYGVKTGLNEAFLIDTDTKERLCKEDPRSAELIRPVLRGRDIDRYVAAWAGLWLIRTFPALKLDIDDYPAIKNYLGEFGKKIYQTGEKFYDENEELQKSRKKTANKWFETQDQIGYHRDFEREIICWKAVGRNLAFCLWGEGKYVTAPASFITTESRTLTLFLLAIFQSKYALYSILENADTTGAGDVMLSIQSMEKLIIPCVKPEIQKLFENYIEEILEKKSKRQATDNLELEIDKLIYGSFNLTDEEIMKIDPKFRLTEGEYEGL